MESTTWPQKASRRSDILACGYVGGQTILSDCVRQRILCQPIDQRSV